MTAHSNLNHAPRRKTPRSCATCHARKVKCDLLKVCTACKRHARSTGRDESTIVCVYSGGVAETPVAAQDAGSGNISSTSTSSGSSSKFTASRKERKLEVDVDYDYQQSDYGTNVARTSKRRRRATANAVVKVEDEEGEYFPAKGMGCGRDARRPAPIGSDDDYFSHRASPIDFSSPPNEFLPTPTTSPIFYAYPSYPTMNRPTGMTRISSGQYIPLLSPQKSNKLSLSSPGLLMTLQPFDFNTFQSQPYDSPIGDFNFNFAAHDVNAPRLPGATPSLLEKAFNFKVEVSDAYPSPPAWAT